MVRWFVTSRTSVSPHRNSQGDDLTADSASVYTSATSFRSIDDLLERMEAAVEHRHDRDDRERYVEIVPGSHGRRLLGAYDAPRLRTLGVHPDSVSGFVLG